MTARTADTAPETHVPETHGGNQLFALAANLLHGIVRDSRLTIVRRDDGDTRTVGRGQKQIFTISVQDPRTLWQMATNPDPGVGELYMDGKWEMVEGDIGAFITMMARNLQALLGGPAGFLLSGLLKKKFAEARTRRRREQESRAGALRYRQ